MSYLDTYVPRTAAMTEGGGDVGWSLSPPVVSLSLLIAFSAKFFIFSTRTLNNGQVILVSEIGCLR